MQATVDQDEFHSEVKRQISRLSKSGFKKKNFKDSVDLKGDLK